MSQTQRKHKSFYTIADRSAVCSFLLSPHSKAISNNSLRASSCEFVSQGFSFSPKTFVDFSHRLCYNQVAKLVEYFEVCFYGYTIPFFEEHSYCEFDKNANSNCMNVQTHFIRTSLATIGVCVFCAAASVVALFI